MSLNSTPNHNEDNEIETLIIESMSMLKRSSKKCGRNEVFDLAQTFLDTDITRETFNELLQNMVESKVVKLRAVGDRECLSLPKEEAKDGNTINNRIKSNLEVFQLQLEKFKSSLYEQFSSFKHSFITEVSQFKSDFLCQKSTRNDQNTMEKLLHQMEKEITFLHEELKSKNTIITLLLENVVKLKDNNNENRSIHSNNDVKITQSEENNTKSTQSIETVEREITSTEPLNIIINKSDTRSRKSNQHYIGDKSSNLNDTITPQNKGGTNRKKTLIVEDSIVKHVEGWRLNKRMKSSVAVKSITGATTKGMKHHIKGCSKDNSPDSIILHVGTNNLKNKEL